jgi:hypothetical protein
MINIIKRNLADNLGWRVTVLLAGPMLLTGCEYMDLSACQESFAVRNSGGSSCPAIECACQEFLAHGLIREDGCYEYHHPVTGEVTVDCECRSRPIRGDGDGQGPGLHPLDPALPERDLVIHVEDAVPAFDPPMHVTPSRMVSGRVLGEGGSPLVPECEETLAGSRCARFACLCEWFLDHSDGECLTYEKPETGETVQNCSCNLNSDDEQPVEPPSSDDDSSTDSDEDDQDETDSPPAGEDDQDDDEGAEDDDDASAPQDNDDSATPVYVRTRASFGRSRR